MDHTGSFGDTTSTTSSVTADLELSLSTSGAHLETSLTSVTILGDGSSGRNLDINISIGGDIGGSGSVHTNDGLLGGFVSDIFTLGASLVGKVTQGLGTFVQSHSLFVIVIISLDFDKTRTCLILRSFLDNLGSSHLKGDFSTLAGRNSATGASSLLNEANLLAGFDGFLQFQTLVKLEVVGLFQSFSVALLGISFDLEGIVFVVSCFDQINLDSDNKLLSRTNGLETSDGYLAAVDSTVNVRSTLSSEAVIVFLTFLDIVNHIRESVDDFSTFGNTSASSCANSNDGLSLGSAISDEHLHSVDTRTLDIVPLVDFKFVDFLSLSVEISNNLLIASQLLEGISPLSTDTDLNFLVGLMTLIESNSHFIVFLVNNNQTVIGSNTTARKLESVREFKFDIITWAKILLGSKREGTSGHGTSAGFVTSEGRTLPGDLSSGPRLGNLSSDLSTPSLGSSGDPDGILPISVLGNTDSDLRRSVDGSTVLDLVQSERDGFVNNESSEPRDEYTRGFSSVASHSATFNSLGSSFKSVILFRLALLTLLLVLPPVSPLASGLSLIFIFIITVVIVFVFFIFSFLGSISLSESSERLSQFPHSLFALAELLDNNFFGVGIVEATSDGGPLLVLGTNTEILIPSSTFQSDNDGRLGVDVLLGGPREMNLGFFTGT